MFSKQSNWANNDWFNNSLNNFTSDIDRLSVKHSSLNGNISGGQNIHFPLNPSLDEEMYRLFADYNNNNLFASEIDTVMRDFRNNGRDTEYCPEFENGNYLSSGTDTADESADARHFAFSDGSSPSLNTKIDNSSFNSAIFKQKRVRRDKRLKKPLATECVFCKNNGENELMYKSHCVKDQLGRVRCPILRAYECPICKAQGDIAHTIKYCPENKNVDIWAKTEDTKYRYPMNYTRSGK